MLQNLIGIQAVTQASDNAEHNAANTPELW